jgi:ribonucleoside-triphosphate reductase
LTSIYHLVTTMQSEIEQLVKGKENFLKDFIAYGKYSQLKEGEDRKEVLDEIIRRNQLMHVKKFRHLIGDFGDEHTEFHRTLNESYDLVRDQYVLPSMRSMQFAGKNIEQKNTKMYNCSFLHIKEVAAFKQVIYLLMCGAGVGFSVQHRHTDQLPPINRFYKEPIEEITFEDGTPITKTINDNFKTFLIPDTVEGWCDAVNLLMGYYFGNNPFPIFDYSAIRPKGSPLKTSGGTAPGHEVFEESLNMMNIILASKKEGEKLKPIEVYDLLCLEAEAVLSGGIRRSAMICLFDCWDQEMLLAKSGTWYVTQKWRSNSNNSVVLHRDQSSNTQFAKIIDENNFNIIWNNLKNSGSGEPGIFWTNDYDLGTNPCAEITLRHKQFCNLTTVNCTKIKNQEELEKAVYAAAFIGTLQASYTDFDLTYLDKEWKQVTEEDALIAVSLTGITRSNYQELDFKKAANIAIKCNEYWATFIGIEISPRVTTIKPEGTGSLILSLLNEFVPSGIHAPEGDFFIKRCQMAKTEPIYQFLLDRIPELIEDEIGKEDRKAILSIPCYAGEGITTKTETAESFLNRILWFYENWIQAGHKSGVNTNNISATCYIGENEWDFVRNFAYQERYNYAAISFYPRVDWVHTQLPQETVSFDKWKELIGYLKPVDFTELRQKIDYVDHTFENVACQGGMCNIV